MSADHVTILCSRGRRLAKMVNADGQIIPYDRARTFDLFEGPVHDLGELNSWRRWLSDRSDCCVVRGAILDPARAQGVRRLLFPDKETGDSPTLCDVPRRWLALDFDSLPRPEHVSVSDLPACAAVAIQQLPPAFRDTSCIVQATASHGIKPGLRLRLWYWLDRPTTGAQLKIWLRSTPIDMSVLGSAQLIFTAAPMFSNCRDHLAVRLMWLSGEAAVRVPPPESLAPTQPKPLQQQQYANQVEAQEYAYVALVKAAQRISAAVEGERHTTLLAVCRSLTPLLQAGALDESKAHEVARRAAEAAGMDDPNEINRAISWAFTHPPEYLLGAIENG